MRQALALAGLLLAAAGLLPAAAAAQGWAVEALAGGVEHQALARDVGTRSAILGVRHQGERWGYLSAAAPLDTTGLPWAAAGLGARLATGGLLSVGVDLAGHAYGYQDQIRSATGGGLTLEGLPFLALERSAARLELYSGARSYSVAADGGTSLSRAVLESGARFSLTPEAGLTLGGTGRWVVAAEGSFPYAGVEAGFASERADAWAFAGRWLSNLLPSAAWGVGGSVAVGEGFRVSAGLQQEVEDPLYWNPPRRLWSVGVSRAFGRAAPVALPAPVLPAAVNGQIVLRVPLEEAEEAPSVAGDFNAWTPVPMVRVGDAWEARIAVGPGVYHYAFRRADGSWFLPESVPARVDDGFGGENAVLVVPGSS